MEGLINKYIISKSDGSPTSGEYFVLKFSDRIARQAIMLYAELLLKEDPENQLAHDLARKIALYMAVDS